MAPKKVLVIASNWGFWGEELQAAWDALRKAGHETVVATPRGLKPLPFAISVDPDFGSILKSSTEFKMFLADQKRRDYPGSDAGA